MKNLNRIYVMHLGDFFNAFKMVWIFFLLGFIFVTFSCSTIRNKLTFYPNQSNTLHKIEFDDNAKEIFIITSDKEHLQAFYYSHDQQQKNKLVIYFHGNGGNLYDRILDAKRIFKMGTDVILLSHRGYGKSSGKPSEEGIYIDGKSTLEYAIDTLGYKINNISLVGRSLGSTVAINTAQRTDLHSVVVVSPLNSGKEMKNSSFV